MRHFVASLLNGMLVKRSVLVSEADLLASALVFAPHPDDETLGCGGIIAKKLELGSRVEFVFLTDGSASHPNLVAGQDLADVRRDEALKAIACLGAPAATATFLHFPDGRAAGYAGEIELSVQQLLADRAPRTVFIPHRQDPPPDHAAVNRSVRAALSRIGRPVTVFEYPIWFWYHWPWVRLGRDLLRTNLRQSVQNFAGLRCVSAVNTRFEVLGECIHRKRSALAAHASQMRRPEGVDGAWQTLPALAKGDFLAQLLTEREFFLRYMIAR